MQDRKSSFLKDNIAIIAGLALPVVVVVLFLLASWLPRQMVAPPQYDLLLVSQYYAGRRSDVRMDYTVSADGKLEVRVYKAEASYSKRLFLFDHETLSLKEILVEAPGDPAALPNGHLVTVAQFADRTVSTDRKAPDGYEFGFTRRRSSDLFGLFFGGHGRRAVIKKGGAVIKISVEEPYSYYPLTFLGWVVN